MANSVSVKLTGDVADVVAALQKVAAAADQSSDVVKTKFEEASTALDKLQRTVTPTVDLNIAAARAKLDELSKALDEEAAKNPTVTPSVDTIEARAKIDELRAKLDEFAADRATASAKVDTGDSNAKLDELAAKLEATSGGASGLTTAVLALGPALVPIAAVSLGGLVALPAILAGAAAGFGALKLGLSGVSNALSAFSAPSTATAANLNALKQAQESAAQGAASAAQTIQSAQSALAQAVEKSGYDQIAEAQAVQQAEQTAANARVQSARSVQQAQQALSQSEQSLQNAEQSEQQAQVALTQARVDAANQITNLNDQMKDGALAQQQAAIDLATAQQALAQAGPGTTPLQMAQLQLNAQQAQQHVQDLADQQNQLAQQTAQANQQGVEGSQGVVSATQGVASAVQGVQNAQQAQANAAQALSDAQVAGAQAVQNADQAVANTLRSNAQQQESDAYSVAQAQQAVTNAFVAQKNQAESSAHAIATAQGAIGASAAAQKAAMDKLTPAGQSFVTFLETKLLPSYKGLQGQTQTALLPGLQAGLQAAMPAFGPLAQAITTAAKGIGEMAKGIGQFLGSKEGMADLKAILGSSSELMKDLGKGGLDAFKGLMNMGAKGAPIVKDIGKGLENAGAALLKFSTSPGFTKFLDYVEKNGPQVGKTLGDVAKAVGEMAKAAAPVGKVVLGIVDDLAKLIASLGKSHPGLLTAAIALGGMGAVAMKLAGPFGKLIEFMPKLVEGFKGLGVAMGIFDEEADANPIGLIVLAVAALALGIYELATHWSEVWGGIKDVADDAWKFIDKHFVQPVEGFFSTIVDFVKKHWELILAVITGPVGLATLFIKDHFSDIVNFVTGLPGKILDGLSSLAGQLGSWASGAWGAVTDAFTTAWTATSNFVTAIPGKILTALGDATTWLAKTGTDAIGGLFTGVKNGAVDLFNWWAGLEHTVLDKLGVGATWLLQTGKDVIGGVLTGVTDGAVSLFNWFVGLDQTILTKLGDATKWLYDIGKDIVGGIVQGLKDAWHTITDTLSDLASHLPGPVKSILGIGSPSRVFAEEIGQWIPAGIAQGITAHGGLVTSALAGVVNPTSMANTGALSSQISTLYNEKMTQDYAMLPGGGLGSNVTPQSIQVLVSTGASPQQIAAEVGWVLRKYA